jgi:hypothetical protein
MCRNVHIVAARIGAHDTDERIRHLFSYGTLGVHMDSFEHALLVDIYAANTDHHLPVCAIGTHIHAPGHPVHHRQQVHTHAHVHPYMHTHDDHHIPARTLSYTPLQCARGVRRARPCIHHRMHK